MLNKHTLLKYNNLENLQSSNLVLLLKIFSNIQGFYQYCNLTCNKLLFGILFNLYELSFFVLKDKINKILYLFKYHFSFLYYLIDIIIIDRPAKKKRFELIYILLSYKTSSRLHFHIFADEFSFVPTISEIYLSAVWIERECWDLFGVIFRGHPDLRRLLTDYGFFGYPMRKDFPLTGHFEVFYSDLLQRIKKSRVLLMQEYRYYDFLKIW